MGEQLTLEDLNPEPLELLDLQKCSSVDDIVRGMSKCSFGARMLGEVADTIEQWVQEDHKPVLLYNGDLHGPFGKFLQSLVYRGWFTEVMRPGPYRKHRAAGEKVVVLSGFSTERHAQDLQDMTEDAIFINSHSICFPGQVRDGHFPNVVFSDPKYIMTLIKYALEQRLEGKPTSVTRMMKDMRNQHGLAHVVSRGAHVFDKMVADPDCTVFMTMSGAMTIAQMGYVICDMIDQDMVQSITSTGALMAHGLVQSIGLPHYKNLPDLDDDQLAELKTNRVTDTLEPEKNLDHVEKVIGEVMATMQSIERTSPRMFNAIIGAHLKKQFPAERGILKSAYEKGVPVYVPAWIDSELGNDVYLHNKKRELQGLPRMVMDMELDNGDLLERVIASERTGIFSIGGGVPRNWTQNVCPLIEIQNERLPDDLPMRTFQYGVRIDPTPMHYGNLSGCTYNEGKSWRKFDEQAMTAEVRADATLVWPFIVKYVMERQERRKEQVA